VPSPADDAPKAAPAAVAIEFGTDLPAAQAKAKADGKALLVVVVPKWFASPEVARLDKDVLTGDDAKRALDAFVRVRVAETEDHEVHARHRVQFKGYPLALVLDADGTFLGSTSGLPAEEVAKTWTARVAAIPPRAKRMKELRAILDAKPEDPQTLFDLALLHVENDEPDRAIALFDRMESADPNGPADRLGEARFQVLRINAVRALADKRFADAEPLCEKWLRRFASHARAPDVLLIEANALYLAGEKGRAKEIWKGLVEKHAATDAGKRAKAALDQL
jgi:tetratricopeptide (TPR) repeat protein